MCGKINLRPVRSFACANPTSAHATGVLRRIRCTCDKGNCTPKAEEADVTPTGSKASLRGCKCVCVSQREREKKEEVARGKRTEASCCKDMKSL